MVRLARTTASLSTWPRGDLVRTTAASLLGAFFIATALLKANSPAAASYSLAYLLEKTFSLEPNLPSTVFYANRIIIFVVAIEAALGALLVTGWRRRAVLIATLTALAIFSIGLVALAIDPRAPSCGCTGAVRMANNAHTENLLSLGRNALLMAGGTWLASPRKQ